MSAMTLPANLDQLTADELRELVCHQAEVITRNDRELNWRQVKIDKLTHEVAYYKRHYFGVKAERLPVEQGQPCCDLRHKPSNDWCSQLPAIARQGRQ